MIHGHLGVGAILAFSAYIVMLQAPFQLLGMLIMLGQRASASARRIYEILDEAADDRRPARRDRPASTARATSASTTSTSPTRTARPCCRLLPAPDARARRWRWSAGPASGKTTVSRLLPRFYDVTGGAVKIDGHDVRDADARRACARTIGVVLDEPFLFSASIRDNIAYGRPDATIDEVRAAARAAGAEEFILELPDGYDTVVGERGYTLSGGQRQRIAIARTLLVNPPILVLDDATSAVDVQVEQEIHEALRVLMEGRTTLIVAHRLSTIGLADRVVLLDGGRIVADGTHAELLETTPLYVEVLAQAEEAEREAREEATRDELRRLRRSAAAPVARSAPPAARAAAAAPGGGLPFAGIPPELQKGVDQLLAEEPDHGDPTARFSYRAIDDSGAADASAG